MKVYVVDGARTPLLKARGTPGPFMASDLAVQAGRPLLARQPFEPSMLDEVIIGCVMPMPEEANIARVISLRLGCGKNVPAWTVQRNCGSGMQALENAVNNIADGRSRLVLAGGTESMSHAPILFSDSMARWLGGWGRARGLADKIQQVTKLRPAMLKPVIGLIKGLTDHTVGLSMGQTAEILAERFNITRGDMDSFAAQSHAKLASAQDENRIVEIETIFDDKGNYYERDDGLRRESSVENLAKLKPVFDKPFGNVTAGNSAQVTDGAALLILAGEETVKKLNLPVMGRIVDTQWAGVDPAQMGLGPAKAMGKILARRGMKTSAVDYWEINEAFSAQTLAALKAWSDDDFCKEELGIVQAFDPIPQDRLNVDGGAIAMGHPIGASGARIVLRMFHILARHGAMRGMASLCIGGGQGGAMLLEREEV